MNLSSNNHFHPKICEIKYDDKNEILRNYELTRIYGLSPQILEQEEFYLDDEDFYDTSYEQDFNYKPTTNETKYRYSNRPENKSEQIFRSNTESKFNYEPAPNLVDGPNINKKISIVKIDDYIKAHSVNSHLNRASIPILQKSLTNFEKPQKNSAYQETIEKIKLSPRKQQTLKQSSYISISSQIKTKPESSLAPVIAKLETEQNQSKKYLNPQITLNNKNLIKKKESLTFVNILSNQFTFYPKTQNAKKKIEYPVKIKYSNTNVNANITSNNSKKTQTEQKIEDQKTRKKIESETVEKQKDKKLKTETITSNNKKIKLLNKVKKKKKTKLNGNNSGSDENEDENDEENDDDEEISKHGFHPNRPQGANLGGRRRLWINQEEKRQSVDLSSESNVQIEPEIIQEENEVNIDEDKKKDPDYVFNRNLLNIRVKNKKQNLVKKPEIIENKIEETEPNLEEKEREEIIEESAENTDKNFRKLLQSLLKLSHFKMLDSQDLDEESSHFILDDDWLLKWCILEKYRNKRFELAFKKFDTKNNGFLTGENLLKAIDSIIHLNNLKTNYLFSVLDLCNVDVLKHGADIKLFTLIVALANRINHLDENWFSNMLPQYDLFTIENKVFKVKNLWSYLVDQETKLIKINDLLIEFEAGGVTSEHVQYAKEKFLNKDYFDIMDYLTYIPLFVYIHDKIINNPLIINKDI